MLSNAYFLAKFRFDTAENEPAKNLRTLPILLTLTLTPNRNRNRKDGGGGSLQRRRPGAGGRRPPSRALRRRRRGGGAREANEACVGFSPKLRGARSRLYRRRFLQVNTRWKALAEIYTMHSFAPFFNLKISVKIAKNFLRLN